MSVKGWAATLGLALTALVLLLWLGYCTPAALPARAALLAVDGFQATQINPAVPAGQPNHFLWLVSLSRTPLPDLPVSAADKANKGFNAGFSRYNDKLNNPPGAKGADRIKYHTIYFFWQHQDPGFHDYLDALRFFYQNYGAGGGALIDSGMTENPFGTVGESQGFAPYPYEPGQNVPVDHSHPCPCTIEVYHQRNVKFAQLLQRIVVPSPDPVNSGTTVYYQLGGLFVIENATQGVVARIIVTAMHPAYTFRIAGVNTGF